MSSERAESPGTERSRVGQGWALAGCLILVVTVAMSALAYVAITQVVLPSNFSLPLALGLWCYAMTWPTTLLGLSAAALRRVGLSIVAIVAGLVQALALLGLLLLILTDLSVTASVFSEGTIMLALVAVVLTTAGAVFALFGRARRWPATATVGVLLAAGGTLVSIGAEAITGPVLPVMGPSAPVSPWAFPVPVAVVLMGLAVAWRQWFPAAIAGLLLLVNLVVAASGLAGQASLILADDHGRWLVVPAVLVVVRLLLALAAVVALTLTLARKPRTTNPD